MKISEEFNKTILKYMPKSIDLNTAIFMVAYSMEKARECLNDRPNEKKEQH